jgi:sugar phosphate isomerase/epimerase
MAATTPRNHHEAMKKRAELQFLNELSMKTPLLACCNFIPEVEELRQFALDLGFQGIDWTFTLENLPDGPAGEGELARALSRLYPLKVRYHLAFQGLDLGDENPEEAHRAEQVFQEACRLISKLGGRFVTMHVGGLGRESSSDLCWQSSLKAIQDLVQIANRLRLRLCVENLAVGWSSRPTLYEKLLRLTGAWATLDLGHALVCQSVQSGGWRVRDFVSPHPERFVNAHVYHVEDESGHVPPANLAQMEDRLRLLDTLPLCDWWVLELREEAALRQTLSIITEYFRWRSPVKKPGTNSHQRRS